MTHSTSDSKYSDPAKLALMLDIKALDVDLFLSADVRLPREERGVQLVR